MPLSIHRALRPLQTVKSEESTWEKAKGRKMFWYSKIGTVSAKKIWGRKMGKHYPNKYKNSSNLADCSGQEK